MAILEALTKPIETTIKGDRTMDKLMIAVAVCIILLIGWIHLSKPAYDRAVAEVGLRIQDHIREIAVLEKVINKEAKRWEDQL